MMDILISETCWAHKNWNKIASDIKLVFYFSTDWECLNVYTVFDILRTVFRDIFVEQKPTKSISSLLTDSQNK